MGRPELTRLYAAASRIAGRAAARSRRRARLSSPERQGIAELIDERRLRNSAPLSRRMPADRDHPRRDARRGGSDRRSRSTRPASGSSRCRSIRPSRCESIGGHRRQRSASAHWSVPAPCSIPPTGRRRSQQAGGQDDRLAQHQRRGDRGDASPPGSSPRPAISRRPRRSRRFDAGAHGAQAVPGRGAPRRPS